MENSKFDIAIIGAGLSGIALARFYLDVHPNSQLIIIEKDDEIGGTWARSRVFDSFWTQSPLRTTSFSDVPLTLPKDAPTLYDTFPAQYVTQYLEEYIRNHIYRDKPLSNRILLSTEVTSVEKSDDCWVLHLKGPKAQNVRCLKLAVASGLTSQPNMPDFPCDTQWKAPILHHRDFGAHENNILSPNSPYKQITVLGGGKSAADMVYTAVKANKHVNWIIRNTGEGPGFILHAAPTASRYRNVAESMLNQNSTKMNPSGFRSMLPEAQSLHQSASGRTILDEQLSAIDQRGKMWANYQGRENARPTFSQLEPTISLFWSSQPPGTMPHDDFWNLVSHRVDVHRGHPVGTTASSLILENGNEIPTDILFAGTGWDSSYRFLSSQQECQLGLPHDPKKDTPEEIQNWQALTNEADQRIINDYPILARPRASTRISTDTTPVRLYQGIAPLKDSSIVFLGRERLPNGFFGAEAQAIWTTAYWDGHVKLPPPDEARNKVAYMNAFSRRRYPYSSGDGLNFYKDLIWYIDTLLSEVGLTSHRKGWWLDLDEPFLLNDLRDCRDEYLAKYGLGDSE